MKKKLLEALTTKFEGVSESILGRIAEKLAKTVTTDEEVTTAVEGVTIQQVLESYGDSRATEAQQTAVKNYESKYGLKDGAKVQDGGAAPAKKGEPKGEDVPEWARQMQEQNKELQTQLASLRTERLTESRKAQLAEITGKLPESIRKAYDRTPLAEMTDEAFTEFLGEVTTEVSGITDDMRAKGAVFGRPAAPKARTEGELTKEQLEAISHRDTYSPDSGKQPF